MFKLLVLCSAFVAMAAAAGLKLNPQDLRVVWETISQELNQREQLAQEQITSTTIILNVFTDNAKSRLNSDISVAAQPFWDGIRELEQEATGKEVIRCINPVNAQLYNYNATLYVSYHSVYNNLSRTAEKVVIEAAKTAHVALQELDELAERVHKCSDVECATELEIEVVDSYNKVVAEIDFSLQQSNNAALIKLPNQLENHKLYQAGYLEVSAKLLEEARECIRRN